MDSASSVISLASSSSKGSRHPKTKSSGTIITVSSEIQRVPVSWESDKISSPKEQVLDLEHTPNHSEKVENWMSACDKVCDSPQCENQSKSTCIRYDFNKSPRSSIVHQSCYSYVGPLSSYMEEVKSTKLKSLSNIDSFKFNGSNIHKSTDCETPLSPESQKKELCNYLQLMKPDDKQESFFIEYRRSARVKTHNQDKDKEKSSSSECEMSANDVEYPTLKSFGNLDIKMNKFDVFNLKRKNDDSNKLLPLPPKRIYSEETDFEDCMGDVIEDWKVDKETKSRFSKNVEKRGKFHVGFKFKKYRNGQNSYRRLNLRSSRLRIITLDTLILRTSQLRKKARKKMIKQIKDKKQEKEKEKLLQESMKKTDSLRCEIISVHTNSDDENVDLKNFVDDMLELDKMSEEHRKSVIESRILASSSITNLINKRANREADVQKAYKIFSDLSNEKRNSEEKENNTRETAEETTSNVTTSNVTTSDVTTSNVTVDTNLVPDLVMSDHDYANFDSSNEDGQETQEEDEESVENSLSPVPIPDLEVLPVSKVETKSLHRSLTVNTRRKLFLNSYGLHNWGSGSNSDRKLNHSISISKKNGAVLRAFYQDYNLVITQQSVISFWTQSALGNVLGAQNMWIPKGEIQRIALNSTYVQKYAMDMIITNETSVAYVELWTKEHKSDVRQVPVADVFATVYFWRLRQTGLEKKALQLENIKGFTDDVQYCVLKCYPRIIVSWHSVQGTEKKTKIHSYHLAADFQTVANISEIQPVEHYVSSLHNIEDCDSLVMGCGENKITLWNVEYGYIVATIDMSAIKSPLSTLWVKCDRGFLFTIQECVDQELRLIAINGMNHSWKKLQNYNPLPGFDRVKGVCIENGILVAYYEQGILCWNAQTGELIVEEVANECQYIPSGKHVIMIVNENIIVRHSLSHLITDL